MHDFRRSFSGTERKGPGREKRRRRRIVHSVRSLPRAMQPEARPPSNDPPPARLQPAGEPSPAGPQATRRQPAAVPNATPQATRHQRHAPPREESVSLGRAFERRATVGVSCVRQERRRHRAPVLQIKPPRPRSTHGITRVPPPRRRRRPAPHRHAARAAALPLRHAVGRRSSSALGLRGGAERARRTDRARGARARRCPWTSAAWRRRPTWGMRPRWWIRARATRVFVPSMGNVGRRRKGFCTKFQALPDLVANTFARPAACDVLPRAWRDAVEGRSSHDATRSSSWPRGATRRQRA